MCNIQLLANPPRHCQHYPSTTSPPSSSTHHSGQLLRQQAKVDIGAQRKDAGLQLLAERERLVHGAAPDELRDALQPRLLRALRLGNARRTAQRVPRDQRRGVPVAVVRAVLKNELADQGLGGVRGGRGRGW